MRMSNSRARQIVNDWLKSQGKGVPWFGHSYVDFVTEARILSGIDTPTHVFDIWDDRQEACAWLRDLAKKVSSAEGAN